MQQYIDFPPEKSITNISINFKNLVFVSQTQYRYTGCILMLLLAWWQCNSDMTGPASRAYLPTLLGLALLYFNLPTRIDLVSFVLRQRFCVFCSLFAVVFISLALRSRDRIRVHTSTRKYSILYNRWLMKSGTYWLYFTVLYCIVECAVLCAQVQ